MSAIAANAAALMNTALTHMTHLMAISAAGITPAAQLEAGNSAAHVAAAVGICYCWCTCSAGSTTNTHAAVAVSQALIC